MRKLLTEKKCSRCKQVKPVEMFYNDKRRAHYQDPHSRYCKACVTQMNHARDWHEVNLKRLYGISKEGYEEILRRQRGKCAICKKAYARRLQVDHDHETGKVRGLICYRCNTALGWYEKTKPMAEKFESYLRRHS